MISTGEPLNYNVTGLRYFYQGHAVTFRYLNRKVKTTNIKSIEGKKFVKLFLQHVLPFRFSKIRHYGFLPSRSKNTDLAQIRKVLNTKTLNLKIKFSARGIALKRNVCDSGNRKCNTLVNLPFDKQAFPLLIKRISANVSHSTKASIKRTSEFSPTSYSRHIIE